ncbi:MAG: CRISPR-associated endonuclease Cas2 [Caenispirillum sp.]|nr:CRISPR-associated endonuclease Cas2 [Caenispirillum sp.]
MVSTIGNRISGYRAMWLLVMFDLPVTTSAERRRARRFHDYLLDEGFTMKQFSVYLRYFDSRAKADAAAERVGREVPLEGMVSILFITDKQFGQMRNFMGRVPTKAEQKPVQFSLF